MQIPSILDAKVLQAEIQRILCTQPGQTSVDGNVQSLQGHVPEAPVPEGMSPLPESVNHLLQWMACLAWICHTTIDEFSSAFADGSLLCHMVSW